MTDQIIASLLELGAIGVLGALFWLMMKHAAGRDIANRKLFSSEAKANRDAAKERADADRESHEAEVANLTGSFEQTGQMMALKIEGAVTESGRKILEALEK